MLAAADGMRLEGSASLPWLSNKGHLDGGVAAIVPEETLRVLRSIYRVLGGDEALLASKHSIRNPVIFPGVESIMPNRRTGRNLV